MTTKKHLSSAKKPRPFQEDDFVQVEWNEDVFEHALLCVDHSVHLTDDPMLRLAALTHDIGKPHVLSVGGDGRTHFFKHEVEGASVVFNWMMETKFSRKEAERVSKLVRHHQFRMEITSDHHYKCLDCGCKFK